MPDFAVRRLKLAGLRAKWVWSLQRGPTRGKDPDRDEGDVLRVANSLKPSLCTARSAARKGPLTGRPTPANAQRSVLGVLLLLAGACNVYDARNMPDSRDGSVSSMRTDSVATRDASGSCPPAEARTPGTCEPGCGELCNGLDDDCDEAVDEYSADASCSAPHADAICLQGSCVLVGCRDGHRDCDRRPETGCEIGAEDAEHCGACDHVCELAHAVAECRDSQCRVARCKPGFADCDGDGASCETALGTADHCGACGDACPAPPHARSRCSDGACGPLRCDDGFADCNGRAEDGCEQALDTLEHCGACDVRCDKASCKGAVCSAADCALEPGSADCDGDEVRCEVDLRTDVDHCGACGRACSVWGETPHARPTCEDGTCRSVCDPGFADCDGDPDNACEQRLDSLAHCGACGGRCAIADASEACRAGRCVVASCNPGFADCDGDGLSCETRLDSVEHCGACSQRCEVPGAVATCAGSPDERSCQVLRCQDGWADCDGLAANGCERDARPPGIGGQGPCLPEPSCRPATRGDDHTYYVCPTPRSWSAARSVCQRQAGGDLAVVHSSAEAEFVGSLLRTRHWIGHTDANIEGLWIWARTGVPFWRGELGGASVNARYSRWARGEPNGSGDCGAIFETGRFDELTCSREQPFVCEVAPDRCPEDVAKLDPGQCGCGLPETDNDGDGFADCTGT